MGESNKCIFHLTQDWTCLGRGHYSSWILINGGRGAKCGHYSSHPRAIIYIRSEALGQIWHCCKSLLNVAEYFYQICQDNVPINQQRLKDPLSMLLCMSYRLIKGIQL